MNRIVLLLLVMFTLSCGRDYHSVEVFSDSPSDGYTIKIYETSQRMVASVHANATTLCKGPYMIKDVQSANPSARSGSAGFVVDFVCLCNGASAPCSDTESCDASCKIENLKERYKLDR